MLPVGGTWLGERRVPGGTELLRVCWPWGPRGLLWLVLLELLDVALAADAC